MADRPADDDLAAWKGWARRWETRAKTNREEIAYLREELAAARAVIATLHAAEQRRQEAAAREELRGAVAQRFGLPAHVVRGDTEAAMTEYAAEFAAWSARRR